MAQGRGRASMGDSCWPAMMRTVRSSRSSVRLAAILLHSVVYSREDMG